MFCNKEKELMIENTAKAEADPTLLLSNLQQMKNSQATTVYRVYLKYVLKFIHK